jgi:hypothetical protein
VIYRKLYIMKKLSDVLVAAFTVSRGQHKSVLQMLPRYEASRSEMKMPPTSPGSYFVW